MDFYKTVEGTAMSAVRTGMMSAITVVLKPFTTSRIAQLRSMAASLDSTSRHDTCHRQRLLVALRDHEPTEEYTWLWCNNPVKTRMKRPQPTPAHQNIPSKPAKSPPRERITEERFMTTTVIGDRHQDGEIAPRIPAALNEWNSLGMMEKVG